MVHATGCLEPRAPQNTRTHGSAPSTLRTLWHNQPEMSWGRKGRDAHILWGLFLERQSWVVGVSDAPEPKMARHGRRLTRLGLLFLASLGHRGISAGGCLKERVTRFGLGVVALTGVGAAGPQCREEPGARPAPDMRAALSLPRHTGCVCMCSSPRTQLGDGAMRARRSACASGRRSPPRNPGLGSQHHP